VACWLAPGKADLTVGRMLRAGWGMVWALLRLRGQDSRRFLAVYGHIEEAHKRVMVRPHWYLWVLGVDPIHQGQGIGGRLMQPILAQADATGLPCYLQTQTEANVAFYQRHGFAIIAHEPVSAHGGPLWYMVREPRSVAQQEWSSSLATR